MNIQSNNLIPTGGQIRMARAYLKWSAKELADKANVALSTVKRIELDDGHSNTRMNNLIAVRDAIINSGKVRFDGDCCVCVKQGE